LREVKQSLEDIQEKLAAQSSSQSDGEASPLTTEQPVTKQARLDSSPVSRKMKTSPGSVHGFVQYQQSGRPPHVYSRVFQQGGYSNHRKTLMSTSTPQLPGRPHDRNRNGSECSVLTSSSEDSELASVEWQMHAPGSQQFVPVNRRCTNGGEFTSPDSGYDSPITVPGSTAGTGASRSSPPTIVGHPQHSPGCMAPRRGDSVSATPAIVH